MRKYLLIMLMCVVAMSIGTNVYAACVSWTWDSGTAEGWYTGWGNGTLTPGVSGYQNDGLQFTEGDQGLTMRNDAGFTLSVADIHNTGSVFIDVNHSVPAVHATYLDVWINGYDHCERYIYYPYDGYGKSMTDLGNGWYRYELESAHGILDYDEYMFVTPTVSYLRFSYNADGLADMTLDNFNICDGQTEPSAAPVPEPATMVLLGLGSLGLMFKRKQ